MYSFRKDMEKLKKTRDKIKRIKNGIDKFFEANLTSYSYLFYAGALVAAVKVYLKYELLILINNIFHSSFPFSLFWVIGLITAISVPLIFVLAFLVTFKYPSKSNDAFIIHIINYTIAIMIFSAAILG